MFRLRAVTNYEIRLGAQLETAIRDWIRDFIQVKADEKEKIENRKQKTGKRK